MAGKRRGAGEGSIYQRADGLWVGSISLGHTTSGRQRRVVYGATRREVQEKLRKLKAQVEAGDMPSSKENIALAYLLDEWLKLAAEPNLRPNTVAAYRYLCRVHIKPNLGSRKLKDLTPHAIQTFLDKRARDAHLSAKTVTLIRSVMSNALQQAIAWGWIARNPVRMTKAPRKGMQRDIPACTPEIAVKLAGVLRSDRTGRPALVAFATGLRIGEVLGLRWADIDLDKAELRVSVQMTNDRDQEPGKKWKFSPLKTKSSARTLALPEFIVRELALQRAEQAILGTRGEQDLVFTNGRGGFLAQNTVRHHFQRLLAAHGLPAYRFHDLRHLYATLLISRGTHVRILSDLLGHANASTTLNVYSHVLPGASLDAARIIDGLLDPPKTDGGEER